MTDFNNYSEIIEAGKFTAATVKKSITRRDSIVDCVMAYDADGGSVEISEDTTAAKAYKMLNTDCDKEECSITFFVTDKYDNKVMVDFYL